MKNLKLLVITLLIGLFFISCETNQDLYIITFNKGGECEDYSLEIEVATSNPLTALQVENELKIKNFQDIKILRFEKSELSQYSDFIYFTEELKNCSVNLQLSSQEDATLGIYKGDID